MRFYLNVSFQGMSALGIVRFIKKTSRLTIMEQQENKQYNPKEAESRIREFWEKEETYKFDSESTKEIYSIDTPPPTVSGAMHIGHAFSY